MIIFDADDFGCSHVISDMCQSHDCRDQLDKFHTANPAFKATLFAIPNEMTSDLLLWCQDNESWIELAVHGFTHSSNYECEQISHEDINTYMERFDFMKEFFVNGFKAPGWQIGDAMYKWLYDHDWWVADQEYNDMRRPVGLKTYKIGPDSMHHHTWNCVGNGVYEQEEYILDRIKGETDFKFVSEMVA